jgi:hypothetical protein
VQSGNVNIDLRSGWDGECRHSTVDVAHCKSGIFRGDLRDERYLVTQRIIGFRSEHAQLNAPGGCGRAVSLLV